MFILKIGSAAFLLQLTCFVPENYAKQHLSARTPMTLWRSIK